jgi:TonB-dependent starch-binding outer membrane protein SusC
MKLTMILMTAALVQVNARAFSQKVTITGNDLTLKDVFSAIQKQTGYDFFYAHDLLNNANKVSLNIKEGSIGEVLALCFKGQPLTYSIEKKTVFISTRDDTRPTVLFSIKGIVRDESGPLRGVSVSVNGANAVAITDSNGTFILNDLKEKDIITFTCIGYKPQQTIIKNNAPIEVKLEKAYTGLNDFVVIGYGALQRKDLTGAVSTVDVNDVEDIPFATIDNALAGKAAGVQVTKTDGSPGGAVRVRIRGSSSFLGGNDPLYVIDGVPVQVQSNFLSPGYDVTSPIGNDVGGVSGASTGLSAAFVNGLNSLGALNPDDIESITILKDASSTAIYGSKAANGVVIINTKRGKKDMKPLITASYYSTVTTPITPDVLNAGQYRTLLTEAAQNDEDARKAAGRTTFPPNTTEILNSPSTFFGTANTNWKKDVTRTTLSSNAEISVQGGGNSSKYFSSISYNSTPGVVNSTGYQRVSGKINLENNIGSKFRFVTNLILGSVNQDIGDGAYDQALKARPDYTIYNAAGTFTDFSQVGLGYQGFQNPAALLTATNNAKTFSLIGSVSGIYDLTKNLEFKSAVSLNSQTYNQRNYAPSYLNIAYAFNPMTNNGGIGSNSNSRITNWFIENTLTYNKLLDKNNSINVLAGTSYETNKTSFFSATASGYPNDNSLTSLSSAAVPLIVAGDDPSQPQSYLLSFYARANYSFMDKYLLTFTGRSDASSKFGPDNKVGYFPSGAIAWRISQEEFLKRVKWIDDIKFRGSYGLTGTQNIGNQMYRTLYSPFSYNGASALIPTQLGNQDIKWESTREADAGLDISLFDSRLQTTVDYYNKQTSGDLLSLPIAPSSSYTSLLSNAAGIKNTGVEVSLQGDLIRTRDFKWTMSVNITWNTSTVTKLNSNVDLTQLGNLTGLEFANTTLVQGKPLGLITGETVTGIIKTQEQLTAYKNLLGPNGFLFPYLGIGDPMYKLDTTQNVDHNTILGSAAPHYFGGITEGFTYKNFDLQFYFTFSQGGKLLWGDHVSSVEFVGTSNANVAMLNRYTPTNTGTDQPALKLNSPGYAKSNLDLFNSSYLKLRTLTLNYHLNKTGWMKKAGVQSAGLFVTATNLFTITKYPGNDPETSDDPYSVAGGYFDASNYPTVKTWSLGLKAGF